MKAILQKETPTPTTTVLEPKRNRYLEGAFAPVSEELTVTDLSVTGHIPEYLDGRYLRNGPNPVSQVDPETYHWFLGDGMVHGVRLEGGRAKWYRNRWVSPTPGRELVANTNVIQHAGKTLALVESGVKNYELSEELEPVAPYDFNGTLPGGYTAHPLLDPDTGELHAVSYFFGWGNRVQYSVVDTAGRARKTVDIEVTGSPMMHAFSLTEKHVIFYDLPVTFNAEMAVAATNIPGPLRTPAKLVLSALIGKVRVPDPISARMRGSAKGNGLFPYRWDPGYPARIGVMPRDGGAKDVRWFEVAPCYVFHPVNAYEKGGRKIVLDVVRHPTMFAHDIIGPDDGPPMLYRWTLDLATGLVREEQLDDHAEEFPRIDERLLGRPYRYGYSTLAVGGPDAANTGLIKHDLVTGKAELKDFGKGRQAGEFVFVPKGPEAAEDEGVLLGFVYDTQKSRSDLAIVDAASLETVGLIHIPARVPHGFHGNWAPTGG